MHTYLFYTSVIGAGTVTDPFISSLSAYSNKINSNDGRVDTSKPNSDPYSMLVEAKLDDSNLSLAQNDPRMIQVIPGIIPKRLTQISNFIPLPNLLTLIESLNSRSFDGFLLKPIINFCEFYKVLLFEFRMRTLLSSDYFKVGIDKNITLIDIHSITQRIILVDLFVDFIMPEMTPRQIVKGIWGQRFIKKHYHFFQTHLDLPVPARHVVPIQNLDKCSLSEFSIENKKNG